MNTKLIRTFLLAAAFVSASPAMANVTYTYTGQSLITGSTGTVDPLLMSLTFSDNGQSLLDWSASQSLIGTISKSDIDLSKIQNTNWYPRINLNTDASGQVQSWYLNAIVFTDPLGGAYSRNFLSLSGLDYWGNKPVTYPWPMDSTVNQPTGMIAFNDHLPGTWTSTSLIGNLTYRSENQVVASVPEPETYGMMLVGLGLMGSVARRRKYQ